MQAYSNTNIIRKRKPINFTLEDLEREAELDEWDMDYVPSGQRQKKICLTKPVEEKARAFENENPCEVYDPKVSTHYLSNSTLKICSILNKNIATRFFKYIFSF